MKVTTHEFEEAIIKTTRVDLSPVEVNNLKTYFLSCRAVLRENHPYQARINNALGLIEHNYDGGLKWYQKPVGLVLIAGAGGVVTYGCLILLGWVSLPSG